jgi:predicted amidohydrolase
MTTWKIAGVQMDCRLAEKTSNLEGVQAGLFAAARRGARLVVFPECVLTGYCFESKEEAWAQAEPIPGLATETLAATCSELGVWAVVGTLESVAQTGDLFNVCVLFGPQGLTAVYRKAHLPYLGVDRFTTPGDRPFAVHDLGGLRVGMNICYDGSFPEAARVLTLLGADLIVLPTNWPTTARSTACHLVRPRALENHVYYAAVNRVGEERGFRFIGQSQIVAPDGELLASAPDAEATILYAEVDPEWSRRKHLVRVPGKHEIHRTADRRPDLYGPLCAPVTEPSTRRGARP